MTQAPHEARRERIARIIDPLAGWNGPGWKHSFDSHEEAQAACEASQRVALVKAEAILADDPALVLVEALTDERIEALSEIMINRNDHCGWAYTRNGAIAVVRYTLRALRDAAAYQSTDKDPTHD